MAVLVTGGAGYIGSVTVELLRARGEQVIILDNLVYGHREAIFADTPFYMGNIGDANLVKQIVRDHKIEACVHFAAFAYVGESVEKPAIYYGNNVARMVSRSDCLLMKHIHSSRQILMAPQSCSWKGSCRIMAMHMHCVL